ncbi:transcriptional regulator protein Pur-beta-like [Sycon ciliatum]|uniref:transcriptional regulator protein Pur-beta-like n=1 Tax=Sycon ciliatum TaxID=27933 RepID=UPI0020A84E14|eukprot:scpid88722/ scgid10537/ Transcriptional activator protein Pur-beta; Purine-rich element-binding protein B; Vascular actin single-stranded DNA-binding factor 2 p44 component
MMRQGGRGGRRGRGGRGGRGRGGQNYRQRRDNSEGEDSRPQQSPDEMLGSKFLELDNKNLQVEIKENHRGKFLKVSEVAEAGAQPGRNRVTLGIASASEFLTQLDTFATYAQSEEATEEGNEEKAFKSSTMVKDAKRYYFDFKENQRGRYLRITQTTMGGRKQIALPHTGIVQLHEAVDELVKKFVSDADGAPESQLPTTREVRMQPKRFYFDVGNNNRGVYLRVTETINNYQRPSSVVTIPHGAWREVRDVLIDFCDQLPYQAEEEGDTETTA